MVIELPLLKRVIGSRLEDIVQFRMKDTLIDEIANVFVTLIGSR